MTQVAPLAAELLVAAKLFVFRVVWPTDVYRSKTKTISLPINCATQSFKTIYVHTIRFSIDVQNVEKRGKGVDSHWQ